MTATIEQDPRTGYGLCECGCGQQTAVPRTTNVRLRRFKGVPMRFLSGHNSGGAPVSVEKYIEEDRGYKTPCWIWQRAKTRNGYARFGAKGKAHRIFYERTKGPIPPGLDLDHLCRVRACVNPDHLEPVTRRENMRRSESPSFKAHLAGTCQNGHPRSDCYVRPNGEIAYCKVCRAEKNRIAA